jgi:hypothetical protein
MQSEIFFIQISFGAVYAPPAASAARTAVVSEVLGRGSSEVTEVVRSPRMCLGAGLGWKVLI